MAIRFAPLAAGIALLMLVIGVDRTVSSTCVPPHCGKAKPAEINGFGGVDTSVTTYCLLGITDVRNTWTNAAALAEMPNVLSQRTDDGRVIVSHLLTTLSLELQHGYESVMAMSAEYDYVHYAPRITSLSSYIYHTNLSSWWQIPSHGGPSPPRHGFSMAYNSELREVVVYGGFYNDPFVAGADKGLLGDVWVFHLGRAGWRKTDVEGSSVQVPLQRAGHTAVFLRDDSDNTSSMVVFGGFTQTSAATADMLLLDLNNLTWTEVDHPLGEAWPSARYLHHSMKTADNTMLMFGAMDNNSVVKHDLWEFNATSMTWMELPPLNNSVLSAAGCEFEDISALLAPNVGRYFASLDTLFVFPFKDGSPWLPAFSWSPKDYGKMPCTCYYNRSALHPAWACTAMSSSSPLNVNFRWLASASGLYGIYHFAFSYDLQTPTEWLFSFSLDRSGDWLANFQQFEATALSVPYHRVLSSANYHARTQTILLFGGMKILDNLPYASYTGVVDHDIAGNYLWIYQRTRQAWSRMLLNGTPTPRYGHASTIIHRDVLLIFSGFHAFTPQQLSLLWCFDLNGMNWHSSPPATGMTFETLSRGYAVISYLSVTNEVIIHGGFTPSDVLVNSRPFNDTWAFQFLESEGNDTLCEGYWKNLNCKNTPGLIGHTAVVYQDSIILFGGATFDTFLTPYYLNPRNDTWRLVRIPGGGDCYWEKVPTTRMKDTNSLANIVQPRLWHTSTLIGAHMVVAGGCIPSQPCVDLTNALECCMEGTISTGHVWVLDMVTMQWTYILMQTSTLISSGMYCSSMRPMFGVYAVKKSTEYSVAIDVASDSLLFKVGHVCK